MEDIDGLSFLKKWIIPKYGPEDVALCKRDLDSGGMKPGKLTDPENAPAYLAALYGVSTTITHPKSGGEDRKPLAKGASLGLGVSPPPANKPA